MPITLGPIRKAIAGPGFKAYRVHVTWIDDDGSINYATEVTFTGPIYGDSLGPIVVWSPGMPRGTFVTDPARYGTALTPEWVRTFYADTAPECRCSDAHEMCDTCRRA